MTGTGDIAPVVAGAGPGGGTGTIENTLVGAFAGLIAVVVVAAMFITAEYRRGLIRITLAASPRRGRVLAAKAIVIGRSRSWPGWPPPPSRSRSPVAWRCARRHSVLPVTSLDRAARGRRHRRAARRGRRAGPGHRRGAAAQRRRGHRS